MEKGFFSDQPILFLVTMAAAFVMLKYLPRLTLGVPFLAPGEIKAQMDGNPDLLIVDVRTEGEFTGKTGHVPGALNLPLSNIRSRLVEIADDLGPYKAQPVCVMCRSENRSPKAIKALKKAGFTNLSVMKGGMMAWKREKLPIEGNA